MCSDVTSVADRPAPVHLHEVGAAPTPRQSADQPVIRVSGLGKCYHVYDHPADRLKQAFFRWKKQYFKEFWALRGVSFEVFPARASEYLDATAVVRARSCNSSRER